MSQPQGGMDPESPLGIPRWVLGLGIVFIILVLLFVVLHLTGVAPMGGHG